MLCCSCFTPYTIDFQIFFTSATPGTQSDTFYRSLPGPLPHICLQRLQGQSEDFTLTTTLAERMAKEKAFSSNYKTARHRLRHTLYSALKTIWWSTHIEDTQRQTLRISSPLPIEPVHVNLRPQPTSALSTEPRPEELICPAYDRPNPRLSTGVSLYRHATNDSDTSMIHLGVPAHMSGDKRWTMPAYGPRMEGWI